MIVPAMVCVTCLSLINGRLLSKLVEPVRSFVFGPLLNTLIQTPQLFVMLTTRRSSSKDCQTISFDCDRRKDSRPVVA